MANKSSVFLQVCDTFNNKIAQITYQGSALMHMDIPAQFLMYSTDQ
jgi:hypothetical protein